VRQGRLNTESQTGVILKRVNLAANTTTNNSTNKQYKQRTNVCCWQL